MGIQYLYPEFEVHRNFDRCIKCRVCERQCSEQVHFYDEEDDIMRADESKCVDCQRCVTMCPTRALKIVKTENTFRPNENWHQNTIEEIYRQATTGGALLSSMGNPKDYPSYWDLTISNSIPTAS